MASYIGSNGVVAIDCEMVGINHAGETQMLARVSIVNELGQVVLDKYVKPQHTVVDYRTSISGIRAGNLVNGDQFHSVQKQVADKLRGRILVGHDIQHDLAVIRLEHPPNMIRDTAKYRPLMNMVGGATPSLKQLSELVLNTKIQNGEHSSVEDAKACMKIYNKMKVQWEQAARK